MGITVKLVGGITKYSLTIEYPATVGNLFLRIRRSLKIDARLIKNNSCGVFCSYT